MSHIVNSYDGVIRPKLAPKSDLDTLSSRACAQEAISSCASQYVRAELKRRLDPTNERCEKIKKNILDSYVFEQKRAMMLQGKEISEQELKENFLATCNNMVPGLIVEAILKCRKEQGRYSRAFLPQYLRAAFQKVCGMQM